LLVFTLGPGREQARRRWLRGADERLERELHERCLAEILAAGRGAGCALRVCTPAGRPLADDTVADRQGESTFGRRLVGAVERAAADSSGPLIVVGTDAPGIGPGLLRRTLETLRRDPDAIVIGPARDGGVYLLAAARSMTRELAAVRWRRADTLRSLLAACQRTGRPVRLLPPRRDLDRRADLESWLAGAAHELASTWRALRGALRAALRRCAFAPPRLATAPFAAPGAAPPGRAPPR
jgi:hypothetical protein